MSKTKLSTDWLVIATAGYTVDGREITATDLRDMAETYDPSIYTALIWLEHYRWGGNFGQVLAVKVEEVDGETKLFAKISPSADLIELNGKGQKLFTSIEILPNFKRTGKAYLYGLAVTDSPASTGTTQLNFSARGLEQNICFGKAEPFSFQLAQDEEASFFAMLKKFFASEVETKTEPKNKIEPTVNNDNPQPQEDFSTMTKQELADAISAGIATAFAAQEQKAQATTQQETTTAEPAKTENHEAGTVSVAEFKQLQADFQALQTKFNAMSREATPVPNGGNPAIADTTDNKFKVTTAL